MQIAVDFDNLSETTLILISLSRVLFLVANIWLDYSFLTPKKHPVWFQFIMFAGTWVIINTLRGFLDPIVQNHYWVGHLLSLLYLVPLSVIFQETLHAKLFVFLVVFYFNQCNFQILFYLELFLFGNMVGILLFVGFMAELMLIPAIKQYLRPHVRNIIDVIDQQNHVFIVLPILSFFLLAFYGSERSYSLLSFIPLILLTLYVAFSYYLIALAIKQTKRNQQLELTSRTDSLTGLYNRRHMEQIIQEEYAKYQRTGAEFALIVVDFDFFKLINDTYGHAGGDFLLKSVSEDIIRASRRYDTVARWGGDEFLLLLPETNVKESLEVAEHINKTVRERRYVYDKELLSVTLTTGVYVVQCGDTVAEIIENADKGMYKGKRTGRNCVMYFDDSDKTIVG